MTVLLLVFAGTLMIGVLISGLAHRSIVSTALLFLVVGFLAGSGVTGVLDLDPRSPLVLRFAELALFSVLFSDGMHAGVRDLRSAWGLPGRALLFGMPLTFAGGTLLCHLLTGLSWSESMLVGAVLTPTDPVFAEALVGRKEVPRRLRHLLNVESGLNDGLALPFVLVLISLVSSESASGLDVLAELALGVGIGIAVPYVALTIEGLPVFRAHGRYQPLNAFAIGLLVLALCYVTHANPFLAAFAAGSTVSSVSPAARASFEGFGELVAELLKLAALLIFGALLSPDLLGRLPLSAYVLAVLLLVLVRPAALSLSLVGSQLARREWIAAAWFGPKGFASVTYGLLVLQSDAANARRMFDIIAITIALSIVAHSSTDLTVTRWFHDERADPPRPLRRLLARVRSR
jgi:NhaP-type Na+/H+ or K+/H+ antiporter